MGLRLCHGDSALEAIELPVMVRASSRPAEGVDAREGIAIGSVRERENRVVVEHARDVTQDFGELRGRTNECRALVGRECVGGGGRRGKCDGRACMGYDRHELVPDQGMGQDMLHAGLKATVQTCCHTRHKEKLVILVVRIHE